MIESELKILLHQFRHQAAETECVEFKEAKTNYDFGKLGKYFSALSNEANLKNKAASWLIFGIKDKPVPRQIVGSAFRTNRVNLDSLKSEIANKTTNRITFIEIHELQYPEGRVVLFEIPPAPKGMPIAWEGHFYGRDGEELSPLNLEELERIRSQATHVDWSAQIVPAASLRDLDAKAIATARKNYKVKFSKLANEVDEWDDLTFLNKAKVTINDNITNAAIILLGKNESEHFLSPAQARISWILKDEHNVELDWTHFGPPLLLNVNEVFAKIRNLKYRYIKDGTLFPQEVDMYDAYVIREALHNCIAHQDYTLAGKVIVVEYPKKLHFSNEGNFIPANILEVLHRDSPDTFYRNKFLADAMVNLNMIDTIGSGIKRMFRKQKERYFPLPEYSIKSSTVSATIYGEILSQQYAKYLATHPNLSLDKTLILDKAQKGIQLNDKEQSYLASINYINDQVGNEDSNQVGNQVDDNRNKLIARIEALNKALKVTLGEKTPTEKQLEKYSKIAAEISEEQIKVLRFAIEPKPNKEIIEEALDLTNHHKHYKKYIDPLVKQKLIRRTIPSKPTSRLQKYFTTEAGRIVLFIIDQLNETNDQVND